MTLSQFRLGHVRAKQTYSTAVFLCTRVSGMICMQGTWISTSCVDILPTCAAMFVCVI
jgi:hypothetical protein